MSKIFDSIKVSKTVKSQVDKRFESLNVESESTLGQASADSIADTKVIEKPQGSDAPRSSDQKAVSDPIEKRTSDEKVCACKRSEVYIPEIILNKCHKCDLPFHT